MKIVTKLLLVAACGMFIFGSCKKSGDDPGATENYDPLTAGSTWTYLTTSKSNTDPTITTTSTFTATARDTVALGKTYKVLTNSAGTSNYRTKVNGEYYRYGVIAALGTAGVEELYLKDGQSLNANWSSTQNLTVPGFPAPVPATLVYSIAEKGISRTVGTRVYNDVVHVHLAISAILGNVGSGEFYYANGIGLIEGTVAVSAVGQSFSSSQTLTASSIR